MKTGILIIAPHKRQDRYQAELRAAFGLCDIHCAGDLDRAGQVAAACRAGVVVCDAGGKQIVRAEVVSRMFPDAALVLVSDRPETGREEKVTGTGDCICLVKPLVPGQLGMAVSSAMTLRDRQRQIQVLTQVSAGQAADLEKTRKALNRCEKRFRSLFESIQEGFYRADPAGRLVMANPVVVKILGYDDFSQIAGRSLASFYRNPEDRELMVQTVVNRGSVTAYEIEIQKRDGSFGHLLVNTHLCYDDNGEFDGLEGTLLEITAFKRLEHELAQSQKLESIGQLAAGIAHEINTPIQYVGDNTAFLKEAFEDLLGLIRGYGQALEQLRRGRPDPDLFKEIHDREAGADLEFLAMEVPAAIDQSLEGVARVSNIVRSMKAFSHPGGDAHEPMDINMALENTVTVARNEWKYVADMALELDPELPRIHCNPGEINQVFLNLVINASHAVADAGREKGKGEIRIRTKDGPKAVEIQISDTGTGIPEPVRNRIFDPFFTTKPIGRGTGQGLAIARSVVDKHRGRIWFETRFGQGSCFFVRLPKLKDPKGA